jgi:hypothetical protein
MVEVSLHDLLERHLRSHTWSGARLFPERKRPLGKIEVQMHIKTRPPVRIIRPMAKTER